MKYTNKIITDYKYLNNLSLRKRFEENNNLILNLKDCDKIVDGALAFYVIREYDGSGKELEVFLYDSELDYFEDLNILGL